MYLSASISPVAWVRRISGRLATLRLARGVIAMDVGQVRRALRHASHPNPRLRLPAGQRAAGLAGLVERPRALDYVLAMSTRKRLYRHQQPVLAIARLLFEHGARLAHKGLPTASLAVVQLRDLELLEAACLNQPLWRMGFAWFSIVDGRPHPMRLSYERHCEREGWSEGASFLRRCHEKERAARALASLEAATPPSSGRSRPDRRL